MAYLMLGIVMIFLSIVFRLAAVFRLTIPLLYALIVPTVFHEWYHSNQQLVLLVIGFFTCGREFGVKTVYTSIMLPVFLGIFEAGGSGPVLGNLPGSEDPWHSAPAEGGQDAGAYHA